MSRWRGVEFKITYADGAYVPDENGQLSSNGLYYTDREGKITISGVVGTIVRTETASIPGYTIDEATRTQTVVVHPNDTCRRSIFYNKPETTLVLEKFIKGTDREPLAGVEFLVTDGAGTVIGPNNGVYTTGEDGRAVITGLTPRNYHHRQGDPNSGGLLCWTAAPRASSSKRARSRR